MTQVMKADAGQTSALKQRKEAPLRRLCGSSGPPMVLVKTRPCSPSTPLLLVLRGLPIAMVD
jgi:hypothetical protein